MKAATFDDLLSAARHGDRASAGVLWQRHVSFVCGAIRRRLSPALRRRYDSDDIAQSVFADVLRGLPRFENRGEIAFRHWLLLKAENKVRDKARAFRHGRSVAPERGGSVAPDIAGPSRSPSEFAAERSQDDRLAEAMRALGDESRLLVHLRAEDGMSFAEIAEVTALASDDAARKRYARALIRLRALLARTDGEPRPGSGP